MKMPAENKVAAKLNFVCRFGALLLLGFLFQEILLAQTSGSPVPVADSVRQADAVCGNCHQEIFRNYLDTFMANASGLARDRIFTGSFRHALSGIDYKISDENGALWLSYSRPDDPNVQGKHKLEYFLGSGHLGLTYLYSENGYFIESPIAYYANTKAFDMKPKLGGVHTLPPVMPMNSGCMRCHMSGVQREDAGTLNHFSGVPFLHAGITCESCHGNIASHIATAGKAAVVNPIKLDPERRDSVCISCHLEGDASIEHAGRSMLDYQPGDRISDYVSYFVYRDAQVMNRGVSEIEQLALSQCKRMSGDRMSCMSCHDPHYSPPPEKRAAFYRQKCLACHVEPKFAGEHFNATPDCTSCHMPKAAAENIPHIAWTDHRLRPRYSEHQISFDADAAPELIPFFKEKTDVRDLALAYYDVVAGGNTDENPRAWSLLTEVKQSHPEDVPVLVAWGYMAQSRGNIDQAMDAYRTVLKLDPLNLTATNNLAILLAKSGQFQEAEALWKKTFAINQTTEEPGINLASAQCKLGERDEAALTLKQVLFYNPDRKIARQKLTAIQVGQESCAPQSAK
jgi:predicted CXXCH cytochrome family protein